MDIYPQRSYSRCADVEPTQYTLHSAGIGRAPDAEARMKVYPGSGCSSPFRFVSVTFLVVEPDAPLAVSGKSINK